MNRIALAFLVLITTTLTAQAGGFGVAVGAYSPNSGLEDNDNAVMLGVDYAAKFALFGIKVEGWYVDSSGNYASVLGEEFGEATVDLELVLAADLMFYPFGTLFYLQAGVNYVSLDAGNIDVDAIDNELGLDLGLGITLFDKLHLQGKMMYTPDAIGDDAADTYDNLDNNLFGYMVSVGWRF